ncbi:MAG: hypothetical protein M5U28_39830 [Sandaracinaceae bacterium]|nr:hypothetical protein [Sandaracinaceae bacterium]
MLGTNGAGSLGDGTTTPRASPAPVPGVTSARQVVASNAGTCIDHDGGLVCFGEQHRIFGLPTDDDVLELRPVTNIPRPILDLDFTGHLCAGTSGGEVYCTGQERLAAIGHDDRDRLRRHAARRRARRRRGHRDELELELRRHTRRRGVLLGRQLARTARQR